jgi:hypothetical protein
VEITLDSALAQYPELQAVLGMKAAGWTFREVAAEDDPTVCIGIVGTCSRQRFTDAIWIFGRTDVVGVRVLDEAYGGGTVWRRDGELEAVIAELNALPGPEDRLAPKLVRHSSLLWTP